LLLNEIAMFAADHFGGGCSCGMMLVSAVGGLELLLIMIATRDTGILGSQPHIAIIPLCFSPCLSGNFISGFGQFLTMGRISLLRFVKRFYELFCPSAGPVVVSAIVMMRLGAKTSCGAKVKEEGSERGARGASTL